MAATMSVSRMTESTKALPIDGNTAVTTAMPNTSAAAPYAALRSLLMTRQQMAMVKAPSSSAVPAAAPSLSPSAT